MPSTKIKYPQAKDENNQMQSPGLIQHIKGRFIHMCYEFNKYKFYSVAISGLFICISYFQIYSQLLNKSFIPIIPEEWGPFSFMQTLFNLVRISPYLTDDANEQLSFLFVYGTLSLIVLYCLAFYYMHFSISIHKLYFIMPIEIAWIYGEIVIWALLIPVCEVYINGFRCTSDGMSLLLSKTKCLSLSHSIHLIFISIGLAIHVVASLVISLYFNDSKPYASNLGEYGLARLDINTEFYFCVFRVLISLLGKWLDDKDLHWVLLALHALYALPTAYFCYRYIPYYNKSISSLYCGCVVCHIWILINIVLYKVMGGDKYGDEDRKYKGVAIVIFIGIALLFIGGWKIRKELVKRKIIEIHHSRISSNEELDLYIQSLLNLYNSQELVPADRLLLKGVITRHKAECMDLECPLKKPATEKLYHPATDTESGVDKTNSKDRIVILVLINSILRERERNRKLGSETGACLYLIYGNFLFKQMGNIHMTIVEIMKAQKASPTIQQEISIYNLLRSVEEYLMHKYKKNAGSNASSDNRGDTSMQNVCETLDATVVIKFENWLLQLLRMVEKCAGEHIEFWSHLESTIPNLNELNKIGLNILKNTNEISTVWKKIAKLNPNHPKALNTYGHYLRDIKNDIALGEEYIDKAATINLHKSVAEDVNNEFEIMFAEDTAVIVINGNPENLGKIIKTNSGVFKLFGYNPYEIYGNDISILMPGLFAQEHQAFMHRYFETGRQTMIQTENTLFALHRNNYLFCVAIVIKPVTSLATATPQYIGLLRQVQKDFDFILADKHGRIDAISVGIYNIYNITSNFIKENQIYIHLICPELADPVECTGQALKLKFDNIQGRHRVTFWIPHDFTSLSHLFSQTAKNPQELSSIANRQNDEDEFFLKDIKQIPEFFKFTYKLYKEKKRGKEFDYTRDNIIHECFNYKKFDFKKTVRCEIMNLYYAGDILNVKVFKLYRDKIVKHKNSLKDYGGKDDLESQQKGSLKNARRFSPMDHRKSAEGPKRSCTGEMNDLKNELQKLSPKHDNDGTNSRLTDLNLSVNKVNLTETFSIQNILYENSKDGITKISDDKKEKQDPSRSSGTKHPASKRNNTLLGSNSDSIPELKPISASNTSELVSNTEEEKKIRMIRDGLIVKTIEPRQMEVAKQLLMRKRTTMDNKEVKNKEGKKNDESQETTEDPEMKRQPSFKSEHPNQQNQQKEEGNLNFDIFSVSTTNHSVVRIIQSLQSALGEMYTPPAISQLKLSACGTLLAFFALTITSFILSLNVYSSLNISLNYAIAASNRKTSIANCAGFTRLLILITCDASYPCLDADELDYSLRGIQYLFNEKAVSYKDWLLLNLVEYSAELKAAQISLSDTKTVIDLNDNEVINPSKITITQNYLGLANQIEMDTTEAIDTLVMQSLNIKYDFESLYSTWLDISEHSTQFILTNGFNSILIGLEDSLDALLDESKRIASKNQTMLLVFLLVANGVLVVTVGIVMPLVVKIRKNKQDLLAMFIEIPIKKAKSQLDKCHLFCKMIHGEDDVEGQVVSEDEKDDREKKNEETDLLLNNGKSQLAEDFTKKRKKFKAYSAGILALVIESIIVITVMELFFFYTFFRSMWFKNTVGHVMDEIGIILNRMISNELYYWIELELIATNGTGEVMNNVVSDYISIYNNKILSDQEYFLQIHSANSPYNSDRYKSLFDTVIYADVCQVIFDSSELIQECHDYMNGVLKKGLNSANVAFWDSLKEIAEDFERSTNHDRDLQNSILIDARMTENHWLLYRYFIRAYDTLQIGLRSSMVDLFSFEKTILTALFSVYIVMLLAIFIVFVKVFVENTKDSLWVTKSLLTILPTDIILQVGKIRHFLMSTSNSIIYGIKND